MYRDEYERCPRCHVELTDAGAVRSCTSCRGQWASHATLMEMALTMTFPERPYVNLVEVTRDEVLACPSCGAGMTAEKFGAVELDECKPHGIWFDRDELEHVLYIVGAVATLSKSR
ncbi:MAG: zf-TFIIB domain-containing protein [Kofleriaceae bacterium]